VSGDVRHSDGSQARRIDLAEAIARDGLGDSHVDDVAAVQHLLRQVPLFKRIGKRHLRLLAGRCHLMRYRPGEPIVRAGFSGEGSSRSPADVRACSVPTATRPSSPTAMFSVTFTDRRREPKRDGGRRD
jgi:hypothetical protein